MFNDDKENVYSCKDWTSRKLKRVEDPRKKFIRNIIFFIKY